MSVPAADIDDVIAFAATDIANVSYGNTDSLYVQMAAWNAGMFSEASGIFKPSANLTQPGQRPVANWFGASVIALDTVEGPGVGESNVYGTANCINAVVRAAYAVKYAAEASGITSTQEDAVVALYNAVWQP